MLSSYSILVQYEYIGTVFVFRHAKHGMYLYLYKVLFLMIHGLPQCLIFPFKHFQEAILTINLLMSFPELLTSNFSLQISCLKLDNVNYRGARVIFRHIITH